MRQACQYARVPECQSALHLAKGDALRAVWRPLLGLPAPGPAAGVQAAQALQTPREAGSCMLRVREERQEETPERLEPLGAASGAADIEYEQFMKAKEARSNMAR